MVTSVNEFKLVIKWIDTCPEHQTDSYRWVSFLVSTAVPKVGCWKMEKFRGFAIE